MSLNPENDLANGVENLLPVEVFDKSFYREDRIVRGSSRVTTEVLQKAALCDHICTQRDPSHFANFAPILRMLEELLLPVP
jgi:hypothetical protein